MYVLLEYFSKLHVTVAAIIHQTLCPAYLLIYDFIRVARVQYVGLLHVSGFFPLLAIGSS